MIINENAYRKILELIGKQPYRIKILKIMNKISSGLIYLIYPLYLIILGIKGDIRFWKVLIIPGISFVLLSLVRKYINASRPYEVFDIVPIINKDTKGSSFPSRHVFSAFIIAMTLYYISMPIGVFLMLLGSILAIVRVVGGVHFPRDVIVGAIIGILSGIIGWNLMG